MKKIFSYVVVAIAAFAMAACGNKSANTGESADSTATEQAAEAAAPSTFAETDFFSVTGPDGWEVKADNSWDSNKSVRMEDVNSTETFKPAIKVTVYKEKTIQEKVEYLTKGGDTYKKGDDLKLGDYTFTTVRGSNKLNYCYAQLEDGRLLEVETIYIEPEAEVVKPVVESIKIK